MDWLIIVVVVLAALWAVLWHRTRQRPTDHPEAPRDPRRERAGALLTAAAAAEREGRWEEAQRARLEATWLRSDPPLGYRTPPAALDPTMPSHLRLADAIRQRYAATLADKDHPYADCMFKPEALLPFPRDHIERTLCLLMAIGRGEITSPHVTPGTLSNDEIAVVERSLQILGTFLDVPPEALPTDPDANAAYGQGRLPGA